MLKYLANFIIYSFLILFLNSCSTISETIDLAGIVDKTEEIFFGKDDEEENKSEIEKVDLNEEEILEEEIPNITDIPTERPEFSDIEKDFFEGENDIKIVEEIEEEKEEIVKPTTKKTSEITLVEKNIQVISQIPENIRFRVRTLLFNSDPPTKNDGKFISYQSKKENIREYSDENKIAVFYFPNNAILPDVKAEAVINEIVKIYNNNSLILVGHASSLGSDTPEGKKLNMNLSFARAESIKNMLINKGFISD
ncbi:MAG: hypothetical protein CFH34_01534, partial [Alphaproteobacteria bacterium MarineAlpha9_Bin4]